MDKLLSFTYFQICIAALQSREIPLGPRKGDRYTHYAGDCINKSGCILQYGRLFGSICWRPEKGGDRFNKVTANSGSTVYYAPSSESLIKSFLS